MQWNLPELEQHIMAILAGQGLPAAEVRLIGLLGQGSRATVFSVLVNSAYHVVKVYDSRASLQQELKNLRKIIPKDRLVFSLENHSWGQRLNLVIIEVPEGRQITSGLLTDATAHALADRMADLHRLRYRQRTSVADIANQLDALTEPFLAHIRAMNRATEPYAQLLQTLQHRLSSRPESLRTRKVRVHGDLWWPNVVVAQEDVYLVDWESVRRGDAAEDLAKFRFYLHYPRNYQPSSNFFWQAADDGRRTGRVMEILVERHIQATGDETIAERLAFYLPYLGILELAQRHLGGHTQEEAERTLNEIIADETLALADNPLADPPDLSSYGYFAATQPAR